jgi:hypothetical protein
VRTILQDEQRGLKRPSDWARDDQTGGTPKSREGQIPQVCPVEFFALQTDISSHQSIEMSQMDLSIGESTDQEPKGMQVRIKKWHAVAAWKWDVNDDCCGICRMPFDGFCVDCKMPGDDCPPGTPCEAQF